MLSELQHLASSSKLLCVGTAVLELKFPLDEPLWGYLAPDQRAEGFQDPLRVRCVCFHTGGLSLGLVNLETGRVPARDACEVLRAEARSNGYDDVVFTATHTHSAPFLEYPEGLCGGIAAAAIGDGLRAAKKDLRSVHLTVGHFDHDLGFNRRVVHDGAGYMRWRNLERTSRGLTDDRATVLCFRDEGGAPLLSLVHYACHPVIAGPENRLYTGDWPGVMCKKVEASLGGCCIYVQGAAGDINPWCDKMGLNEGAYDLLEAEGGRMAERVIALLQGGAQSGIHDLGMNFWRCNLMANLRHDYSKPALNELFRAAHGPLFDLYLAPLRDPVALPISTLSFGVHATLNFGPGEFFTASQLDLRRRSLLPNALLCGYADEYHLYIPTLEASLEGGYGADTCVYVAPGTAEAMVNQYLVWHAQGAGRLKEPRTLADLAPRDWPVASSPS